MDRTNLVPISIYDPEEYLRGVEIEDEDVLTYKKDIRAFQRWLVRNEMNPATIRTYCDTVSKFFYKYHAISKNNLIKWKNWLISLYAPATCNQRIYAMNKYLIFINRKALKVKGLRVQAKPFLENVISFNDYKYLIKNLKKEGDMDAYILVKFIACTGARVSEVVQFRVEHIERGYMQLLSKSNKIRRIYIPKRLQTEALKWLKDKEIDYGPIFLDTKGNPLNSGGVNTRLKAAARKYPKIPIECVYPHSFRHMYAKAFLSERYDLMLLADLLGHSSLEITRIYTRMSSEEQKEIIDKVVTW